MKPFGWILCALISGTLPGLAQDKVVTLSLEGSVRAALLNNRDLRAARFAIQRSEARLRQAGRLANPELEASGIHDFAFANKGEAAFSAGISQTFPLTSRLGLTRSISRLDVERARREVLNQERLLIEQVHQHYIRAVAAKSRAAIWQEMAGQHEDLVNIVKARLNAGQSNAVELALATSSQAVTWNELSQAETESAGAWIALKTLLGLPSTASLHLTDSLPDIVRQLRHLLGERPTILHRPDADLLLLDSNRAELEIRLARAEAWEGVRIGVEYSWDRSEDAPEGLGTDQFLGVKVSLPLPLWNSQQGQVAEKQAGRDELQAKLDTLSLEITNSLADAWQQMQILSRRQSEIQSQGITLAKESERSLRIGYQEGRVDLRDWLTTRSQLAVLRSAQESVTADLALVLARLLSITGRHPAINSPKNGVGENPGPSAP